MDSVKIKAPAKINMYLAVGEKMENGYHEIKSIMQSISLYDTVTVTKTESGIDVRSIQGVALPHHESWDSCYDEWCGGK